MQKLTFLGDIMCEPPILKASRRRGGVYDFDPIFAQLRPLLADSDLVISNLETPLAGPEAGYTDDFYVFNAPDSYADALKNAGVGLVITANNHVFDRGFDGLARTLRVLDARGLPHTGTWSSGAERQSAWYTELGGTRIAFVAYTYGTNWRQGRPLAEGQLAGTVNLLRPQTERSYLPGVAPLPTWVKRLLSACGVKDREWIGRAEKFFGYPGNWARRDDLLHKQLCEPYVAKLRADIREAKTNADLVFFVPHMGGQFSNDPGLFSRFIVEQARSAGADAIIASHSHAPQQLELLNGVPCAWSLGNLSMCPYSSLMIRESLPDYGLAVHLYIEDKTLVKTTFSILKGVQTRGKQLVSWPVDRLYAAMNREKEKRALEYDVRKVYTIITKTGLEGEAFRAEYDLPRL